MIKKTISHYKILEKLGEGGMGKVYLTEDTKLERKVALKFLPSHLTVNKEARERFEREAKAAAALNHPNIITIYEISEFEGQIYIAMEYVDGIALREKITDSPLPIRQKDGGRTVDNVVDITTQICQGLSKAHQAGIVHRDIKPENILIDKDGRVKILDFGIAKLKGAGKLTKETSTLGTVNYMSPEQARGEDVDFRTDIWSLGVVLYEMITGQLPFKGEYEQAVIYSIINEEPEPVQKFRPDFPTEFEHLLKRALEKEPENRYQLTEDILVDLRRLKRDSDKIKEEHLADNNKVKIRKKSALKLNQKTKRLFLPVSISVVLIILLLTIYVLKSSRTEPPPPMEIRQLTDFPGYESDPEFSPDGTKVSFVRRSGKINKNQDIYVKPSALKCRRRKKRKSLIL